MGLIEFKVKIGIDTHLHKGKKSPVKSEMRVIQVISGDEKTKYTGYGYRSWKTVAFAVADAGINAGTGDSTAADIGARIPFRLQWQLQICEYRCGRSCRHRYECKDTFVHGERIFFFMFFNSFRQKYPLLFCSALYYN